MVKKKSEWRIFLGNSKPHFGIRKLPAPPPWRPFRVEEVSVERKLVASHMLPPATRHRGITFQFTPAIVDMVNAALLLRRPLLITGPAGSGKSSLIDAVAYELNLGEPLRWRVNSRSTLRDALYGYDAIGRLQAQQTFSSDESQMSADITSFIRLGPLGTAMLPTNRPRALLIDEIDKGDADLPNDLLNILEDGEYEIPELARIQQAIVSVRTYGGDDEESYPIVKGRVRIKEFPLTVLTSNGERDFSAAFKRRCLVLDLSDPCADPRHLSAVVQAHLGAYLSDEASRIQIEEIISSFVSRASRGNEKLATDQLLNAVLLVVGREGMTEAGRSQMIAAVTHPVA